MTNDIIRAIYPGFTHISVLEELAAFEILLNGSAELYFGEIDHSKMITGYRNDDRDYLNTLYKRLCAMAACHFRQAKSLDSLGEYLSAMEALGNARSYRMAAMENHCGQGDLKEQDTNRQRKAANASHAEDKALKEDVVDYYLKHRQDFKNKDIAAEYISNKIVHLSCQTVRNHLKNL